MINDKKDYKIKYNQYIKCPICEGLFNLIRSNEHINTKKCLYIQSIKDKGDNITIKEKLFLKINEQKQQIKNNLSISGDNSSDTG
jgi:hypothetical protein